MPSWFTPPFAAGSIQLPQWDYEDGGSTPSGAGKFTQSASSFSINKQSVSGYDATTLISNFTSGDFLVFTAADGGVSIVQVAGSQSPSGDVWLFSSVSTYGEAFSAQRYSLSVVSSAAVSAAQAAAADAQSAAGSAATAIGAINVINGLVKCNGGGSYTAGTPGSDFVPPIGSSTAIQKGDGAGSLTDAIPGTDYVVPGGMGTVGQDSGWSSPGSAGDKTVSLSDFTYTGITHTDSFPDFDSARAEIERVQDQVQQMNKVLMALQTALLAKLLPG